MKLFSSCSCGSTSSPQPPNPNPFNFTIHKIEEVGNYTIVLIVYPDCSNYEGHKILVFKDCVVKDIETANRIDPHFCKDCKLSPIARFEPTRRGWNWAIAFAKGI